MDTDSFIQALQQLIARRGEYQVVAAQKKLGNTQYFLQNTGADYTVWHRNPTASSHMRGVWER